MRSIALAAAAAMMLPFSDLGLAKAAPQPVRRGSVDLSSPYIPPARPKSSADEKRNIRDRMRLAQIKRNRKADKLRALVASGAMKAA